MVIWGKNLCLTVWKVSVANCENYKSFILLTSCSATRVSVALYVDMIGACRTKKEFLCNCLLVQQARFRGATCPDQVLQARYHTWSGAMVMAGSMAIIKFSHKFSVVTHTNNFTHTTNITNTSIFQHHHQHNKRTTT